MQREDKNGNSTQGEKGLATKEKVDETRMGGGGGEERGRWKQSKEQHSTKQCSTISGVVGGG